MHLVNALSLYSSIFLSLRTKGKTKPARFLLSMWMFKTTSILFFVSIILSLPILAQTATQRNYFPSFSFIYPGWNVKTISTSPEAACAKSAVLMGVSNSNLFNSFRLDPTGNQNEWRCQAYKDGQIVENFYRRIHMNCTSPPINSTMPPASYPSVDYNAYGSVYGNCFCTGRKFFDKSLNGCVSSPSQCPIDQAFVRNGQWVCEQPQKQQGIGLCPVEPTVGNPINLLVGNKYQIETDFVGDGTYPLSVSRTYNSISGGWQFFSQIDSTWPATDYSEATVIHADGKALTFIPDGIGGWLQDADVRGRLSSLSNSENQWLGWRYVTSDNLMMTYDQQGRLTASRNQYGQSHVYHYDDANQITVTDQYNQQLVYQLDDNSRITSVHLPNDQTVSYTYHNNNLIRVVGTDNQSRIYHYENPSFPQLLTGITDENNIRYASWSYDQEGRAVSSEHAGQVEKVTLDYSYADDADRPRIIVTNSLGKQTTYHYARVHGGRKVTQVEGHVSANCAAANQAYSYDANGFMASKTDWQGNVTTYVHNDRGQELSRTEASGTLQARTIITEWHPEFHLPIKIVEPERETVMNYDTSNRLLSRQIRVRNN